MREFLELLLPRRCAGCGAAGAGCCIECRRGLDHFRPMPARPDPCPPGMPFAWAAAAYSGPLRAVIIAWKDQDRTDLDAVLVPLLARALSRAVDETPQWAHRFDEVGIAVAVPIPSRTAGTRARGRIPVAELARMVLPGRARGLGIRTQRALRYGRPVRDQAGLNHQDRARNVAGAMQVSPRSRAALRGVPVILIDDIVTTGSTLTEATRAVLDAGAGPVIAVALAATQRQEGALPDRDQIGIPPRSWPD